MFSMAGFPSPSQTETHPLVLELVVASSCQTNDKSWFFLPKRGLRFSAPNRLELGYHVPVPLLNESRPCASAEAILSWG